MLCAYCGLYFDSDIGLCEGCGYLTDIPMPPIVDKTSPLIADHPYSLPSQNTLKRRLDEANDEVWRLKCQNERLESNEILLQSKVSDFQQLCSDLKDRLNSALNKYNLAMAEKNALEETVQYLREKANIPVNLLSDIENMGAKIPALLYKRMAKRARFSTDQYPEVLQEFALTVHLYSPKAYRYFLCEFILLYLVQTLTYCMSRK